MRPLSGLLILDLSRVLSGPYCSMYLGDLGARVIKIERPPAPDGSAGDDTRHFGPPFVGGESTYYLSVNRNKESVALDIKTVKGRDLIRQLAARADVLLENFRPGVLDRLGLSYASLRVANPRLIYCSISGFGTGGPDGRLAGPLSQHPGYDVVVQGMGGFAALTGDPDRPPSKAGVSIADLVAGLNAVIGVLAALHARQRTGRGQHVDISMLDGQVALLTYHASMYLNAGAVPRRMGNRHPSISPYETYRTGDGHLNLAVANDALWHSFLSVLDGLGLTGELSPPLGADARFLHNHLRVENREALAAILEPLFLRLPTQHWLAALEQAGVPCGPILSVGEVLSHPQVLAREMVVSVPHPELARRGGPETVTLTGVPIKLSETPGEVSSAPPLLGQHTQALGELLGLSDEELAALAREGVIAIGPCPLREPQGLPG